MRGALPGLLLFVACAGGPPAVDAPVAVELPLPAVDLPHLEERALLLLLVDQQLYDPFTVNRVRQLGPEMRVELARALARAGDTQALPVLENFLLDGDVEVRREAAFALGVLGDGEAIRTLARASRDPDHESGRLAVEALAKLEAPIGEVIGALEGIPPDEFWSRLAPSLYRFPVEAALPIVRRALIEGGDANYRHAMYALARNPHESSLPVLRELLGDPDPWLRSLAARAVGRVGDRSDLERLEPLLDGAEVGPVVQALRSSRRLVATGLAAPAAGWAGRLVTLIEDPRPGVRLSAIETAGAWGRSEALGAALVARFEAAEGRERELALLALAAAGHPRAADLIGTASGSAEPVLRQRAAAAAGLVKDRVVLERLLEDESPAVRGAAFGELFRLADPGQVARVSQALGDRDPVVRAIAFEWVRDNPVVPVADLLAALGGMGETDVVEAQSAALAALQARAEAVPDEREAVVAALRLLTEGAGFVLRGRAGDSLVALGEAAPAVGPVASTRRLGIYRDLVRQAWPQRSVRLTTSRGDVDLRLECRQAPLTCVNFLQLVGVGFYDGLTLHRVLPDFVIQGGDPRGDGYGGPGYMIRDEINRLRYEPGRVGMALAGPHTGGSQFFITLSPQPHLDGSYTIFGHVVAGRDVLDEIVQGDTIVTAREIATRADN